MLMIEYKQLSWWLWLVAAVLLGVGLFVTPRAFKVLIVLSMAQTILYVFLENNILAFPVQVRFAYTLIVSIAYWEPMRWLYWIPFVGTSVVVLTGYCLLARIVSLLPVNRAESLTASLVRRTIFSKPVAGSILQGLPPHKENC